MNTTRELLAPGRSIRYAGAGLVSCLSFILEASNDRRAALPLTKIRPDVCPRSHWIARRDLFLLSCGSETSKARVSCSGIVGHSTAWLRPCSEARGEGGRRLFSIQKWLRQLSLPSHSPTPAQVSLASCRWLPLPRGLPEGAGQHPSNQAVWPMR